MSSSEGSDANDNSESQSQISNQDQSMVSNSADRNQTKMAESQKEVAEDSKANGNMSKVDHDDVDLKKKSSFADVRSTKIQITWKGVTVTAPPQARCCRKPREDESDLVILDDLNGTVKPGQFLSIIGASGAGKTTFLNYLSGKDPSKNLNKEGNVMINGVDRSKIKYGKYLAYVQQDDVLMQTMTVRECLMFSAQIKLPPGTNMEERVEEIITSLKLNKCSDTKIGGPMVKGISGGERKRTSIGVEIITDPSLIFLDEPTTGLDSYTATNVVRVLRELASSGRTVIATIHQPNSEAFSTFDQLCLMAHGHIIYHNEASKAVDYFSRIGYSCPERTNPADFFMDMMSIEAYEDPDGMTEEEVARSKTMIEENYKAKIAELHDKYENSELKNDADDAHPEATSLSDKMENSYRANACKQFGLIFLRSERNIWRMPVTSSVKIISTLVVAIAFILVYGHLGHDRQSIQSRNGVIFILTMMNIMGSITNVSLVFPDERPVYIREQGGQLYGPTPYFFAKIIGEFPIILINTTLVFVLDYFAIGLNTESVKQPLVFYFYVLLLSLVGTGIGYLIGASVSQKQIAVILTPIAIIPFTLVAGYFVNQNNFVPILIPFEYVSPFKYAYQVLTLNEYDDLDLDCQPACDPIGELDFEQTLEESVIATVCLGLGIYAAAYLILYALSRRAY